MRNQEDLMMRFEYLQSLVEQQNMFIHELITACEKKDEELYLLRKEVYELRGKLDDYEANLM